jgi:GTP cyclohydrolase IA
MNFSDIIADSFRLGEMITASDKSYDRVFGVPAGGILSAYIISTMLKVPLVGKDGIDERTLIVDDLIDSGRTLKDFLQDTAVLYRKPHSPKTTYFLKEVEGWVILPHDKETGIEEHLIRVLEYIGENPNRQGLIDTPRRMAKMYEEIYRGYKADVPKITTFENGRDGIFYNQMIVDTGYFYSMCEHHSVPFFGKYFFAYIPNKKIMGLSKVARIIDHFSAKLQVQERLGKEVLDEIEKEVQPLGSALVLKARHLCKEMRGIKKVNGEMTTSVLNGVFLTKSEVRNEFLNLIK